MESSKIKLVDQVAKLNDQQFQVVLQRKVSRPGSCYPDNQCFINLEDHHQICACFISQDLLIRAVVLKRTCTQENMASIELDTKVCL